jgi:hypothetical protein
VTQTDAVKDGWVPASDTFAARLMLVRHRMRWNLKQAALECGLPAQSWRDWEIRGKRPRDYEGVCQKIAARTECDLIWLMLGQPLANMVHAASPDKPVGWLVSPTVLPAVSEHSLVAA